MFFIWPSWAFWLASNIENCSMQKKKKIEAFQQLKLFDIVQQFEIYLSFSGFNMHFN